MWSRGQGWGQADLFGVKESERELNVLFRRRKNHSSLNYKVVLVGPNTTNTQCIQNITTKAC